MVNEQEETALAYYFNGAKRLTHAWIYGIFGRWMTCNAKQCKADYICSKLDRSAIPFQENQNERGDSLENLLAISPGNGLNQNSSLSGIYNEIKELISSDRDISGIELLAGCDESVIDVEMNGQATDLGAQEIGEVVKRFRERNRLEIGSASDESCSSNLSASDQNSAGCSSNSGFLIEPKELEIGKVDSKVSEVLGPAVTNPSFGKELSKDRSAAAGAGNYQ